MAAASGSVKKRNPVKTNRVERILYPLKFMSKLRCRRKGRLWIPVNVEIFPVNGL
jgi:hypothetical protein